MTEGMSLLLIFLFNINYLDISVYAVMIKMEHINVFIWYFCLRIYIDGNYLMPDI